MPNPWDIGSARILEGIGFKALATTSAGFALTLGRQDYRITRDEAMEHARGIVAAVGVPVAADLENGFGPRPEDAAETIRQAAEVGLAGGSIEDATGDPDAPIFELTAATERVAAAVEAARGSGTGFVLTARAEAYLHRQGDLDQIIERLRAFEAAGADVLYAPGLPDFDAVRRVCNAISKPVNVLTIGPLARSGAAEIAAAGASRISVGGRLAFAAYGMLTSAAAMLENGSFEVLAKHRTGASTIARFLTD